jgi:putative transposase
MNVPRLCINSVYRFDPDLEAYRDERILWLDDAAGSAAMIDVRSEKAKLHFIECRSLDEQLDDGSLVEVEDPYSYLMMTDDSYSEVRRKERDSNAAAMALLTEAPPEELFSRAERGKLIRQIGSRAKDDPERRNPKTVYDLLRRYWQRGQMANAFLSDRHLGGWHKEEREADPVKQENGQRRKGATDAPKTRFTLTRLNEEILVKIGRLYWRTRKKNGKKRSWKEALQKGYERFFAKGWKTVDGVRVPILPPTCMLPNVGQLKRAYYKNTHIEEIARKREGTRKYNLKYRALRGDQRKLAWGPMHFVQMDTQTLKIYAVDVRTREVIGRPSVTMGRDTMSRLITGFSLTIGCERAMQYKLTYLHMAEDKVVYCKQLGIDITPDEWPCCHIPSGCLVDNGAGNSKAFHGLNKALKTRFYNTAGSRPDMKPIIESGFNDLTNKLISQLPGAVLIESTDPDSDPATKKYIEQASLDMGEIERAIVYYILDYNQRVLEDYPLTDAMRNVDPIPIQLWNWGIKQGAPRRRPIELVRLHCLSKGTARVTPEGIIFEQKSYECERCIAEGWQTRARLRGTWKIDVLFDERNLANIYLRRDMETRSLTDPYVETCWRTRVTGERVDVSLDDLRREQKLHRARLESLAQDRPQRAAEFNAKVTNIADGAERKTAIARLGQKQSREGMGERQKTALREEWQNIKPLVEPHVGPAAVPPIPNSADDESIDDLPAENTSDYDLVLKDFGPSLSETKGASNDRA